MQTTALGLELTLIILWEIIGGVPQWGQDKRSQSIAKQARACVQFITKNACTCLQLHGPIGP